MHYHPRLRIRSRENFFSDIAILEKWRDWHTSDLLYKDRDCNASLVGALDDCLVENNYYIPLDYKTRGSELTSDPRKYYQTQLDCYCLMLESCGYKTKGLAYLIYYWPEEVREKGNVKFHVEPIRIETNIESARNIIKQAATLLSSQMPPPRPACEFCNLVAERKTIDKE